MKHHILITGAGSGIGLYLAKRYIESKNYYLTLHAWKSQNTITQLKKSSPTLIDEVFFDITDPYSTFKSLKNLPTNPNLPPITTFIHNASLFVPSPISHIKKNWENIFEPSFKCLCIILEYLLAHGDLRNIIFIGDTMYKKKMPNFLMYKVSKGALVTMAQSLAYDLSPKTRVNIIHPGFIDTNKKYSKQIYKNLSLMTLLKRWGTCNDVYQACSFLLENNYITGQEIYVDGGLHLTYKSIKKNISNP